MEPMIKDCWLPFPMHETGLNQDLQAISRFCPARALEEERGAAGDDQYYWELLMEGEAEAKAFSFSPIFNDTDTPNCFAAASSEEEEEDHQFVDSFFNMDCYHHGQDKEEEMLETHLYDSFFLQDDCVDLDNFSLMAAANNNINGDNIIDHCNNNIPIEIPMMIEAGDHELSSSCEDSSSIICTTNTSTTSVAVEDGLQLVHLLLACAEAVGCRDTQLANSMLSQIWYSADPWGDSLQRVSYCFAIGLKSRLLSHHLLHMNLTNSNGTLTKTKTNANTISWCASANVSREERIEAFHLLHQTTPYIAFGFIAANEAISQAAQGKDYLHIVDLGMHHTLQWPSLIKTIASRPEGPLKLFRITGIVDLIGDDDQPHDTLEQIESRMKRVLVGEANSVGIKRVEFQLIPGPATPSLLTRENLNIRDGESLFVNSILHLHTYVNESRGSLETILQAIKKLGPTLVMVVEQDANHNGPFFLGRFLESLHYYSAIFDSMEASLARNRAERMKIEKHHFAEEIRNIVAYKGSQRIERHERADQWRRQMGRAGFQVVGMKGMKEARMVVSEYGCDGYTVGSEKGYLLLGWKGRPIMLASAWQLHTP